MSGRIFLSSPHMGGYEMSYIDEAFKTNWVAPLGENVDWFERELCDFVDAKQGVALSSGTAAIHLALVALGVKSGDSVFCSDLTFSASANPIVYQNATPVFIDSEYESWNMCPIALEKAFEQYKPKAVIVVGLYGQSAKMDEILEVCNYYNSPVIEDAAEALGATYKGRHCGTFGKIGVFSFNGNKIITTSGGGMLVCDDKATADKVRFLATQAREPFPWYEHRELGYNYRLSNVCAGIGRGQMRVLLERIEKKKYIFEYYQNAFEELEEIEMMPVMADGKPNYWLSCVILNDRVVEPIEIIDRLAKENIEARPIWKPMHMQPFYRECAFVSIADCAGVSEDVFYRGLCLPSDTKMTDVDLDRVVRIVREALS